jgi:hypothetical protein
MAKKQKKEPKVKAQDKNKEISKKHLAILGLI